MTLSMRQNTLFSTDSD